MEPQKYDELTINKKRLLREDYITHQEGKCYYCHSDLTGRPSLRVQRLTVTESLYPPNFFNHPVHLHHDHNTGLTLGAVHCKCNAVLWEYEGE